MNLIFKMSLFILASSLCLPAFCEEGKSANCDPETGRQTTYEMLYCAGQDFSTADQTLNKNYKLLLTKLNAKEKKVLITSEKAWLNVRDKNCELDGLTFDGGSLQRVIEIQCRAGETEERAKWLQQQIDNRSN